MKSAWVSFGCSTSGRQLLAVFRNSGTGWQLTSVQENESGSAAPGQVRLAAPFSVSPEYRGCPSCESDSFVRCGTCGRLACWRSTEPRFNCPGCHTSGIVSGSIEAVDAQDAT